MFIHRSGTNNVFVSTKYSPGADPGFPVGGGANPPGGRQHMILPNFMKNCMKLRKFWAVGGGAHRAHPPKSATAPVSNY